MTFNTTDELDNQKIAKKKILKFFLSRTKNFLKNLPEKNSPPPLAEGQKMWWKKAKKAFFKSVILMV